MKPYSITAILICLGILFLGFSYVSASDTSQPSKEETAMETLAVPMGNITLSALPHIEPKRSEVNFPHSIHFTHTCATCHHKWDLVSPVQSCGTSGCHDLQKPNSKATSAKPAKPWPQDKPYFQDAFHTTCLGCHRAMIANRRELVKAGTPLEEIPTPGPAGCNRCHPKD
jgi:hypothetical protein